MSTESAEEKIEEAIERVANAEEIQAEIAEEVAEAQIDTAQAIESAALSEATENTVAAAQTAVVLAQETAALANVEAAKAVLSHEEELAWQRQQTENLTAQVADLRSQMETGIANLSGLMQQALERMQPPTQPSSETSEEQAIANPASLSALVEGLPDSNQAPAPAARKRRKVFI